MLTRRFGSLRHHVVWVLLAGPRRDVDIHAGLPLDNALLRLSNGFPLHHDGGQLSRSDEGIILAGDGKGARLGRAGVVEGRRWWRWQRVLRMLEGEEVGQVELPRVPGAIKAPLVGSAQLL